MFAAAQHTALDTERDKRLVLAALAAVAVVAGAILTTAFLASHYHPKAEEKTVDVSFRPPPPPPPPAKIDNPPPPPPAVKKVALPKPPAPVEAPVVAAPAPAPAAAAMVAPKEAPKEAPPESATPVAAIALAVGGTGDGTGSAVGGPIVAPSEDDSPAPVEVKANTSGPVNLPEEADAPEPDENNAPPEYPEAMRATGQEARVVLKVVVEKTGTVGRIQVLKGDEPFVAAAIAAVKTWRFSPAQPDGQAIAAVLTIPAKFPLRE
ncbi:MAG: TonB family protein [Myxococcaceae bacterium]